MSCKELERAIEFYSKTYVNITIIGDFNAEISEFNLASFCTIYNFNPIQGGGKGERGGQKDSPFSNSANLRVIPQNFLTFSFNTFTTLVHT